MKDLFYENQGVNIYLTYKIDDTDEVDTMSLGMLTNNKTIPGLAQTLYTQIDLDKYIKFNVTSKVSVEQIFSGTVRKKTVLGIFNGIADALMSAEDYMIDLNSIILDKNYIFTDVVTGETDLICLPIINSGIQNTDVTTFLKDLIKELIIDEKCDATEPCDHLTKILKYLNSASTISFADFKQLLIDIEKGGRPVAAPVQQIPVQAPAPAISRPEPKHRGRKPMPAPVAPIPNMNVPPVLNQQSQPLNNQMNVPPVQPAAAPAPATNLKEKFEHFKAQKKAKKEASKANGGLKHAKSEKPGKPVAQNNNFGFAIPGQIPSAPATNNPAPSMPQPPVKPVPPVAPKRPQPPTMPRPVAPMQNPIRPVAPVQQPQAPVAQAPVQQPFMPRPVQPGMPQNFGQTTVLNVANAGETTVLSVNPTAVQAPTVCAYLIRMSTNEKVKINQSPFRIGREQSYAHYVINGNSAISSSHANIIKRDDRYFILDTNSRNHTFLNGEMIPSNEEFELQNGDSVKFANEDFEFKIM